MILEKIKRLIGKKAPAIVHISKLLKLSRLAGEYKQTLDDYIYDFKRFCQWSSTQKHEHTLKQLRALITVDYHRLEKGLAFREPRVGFGKDAVTKLLAHLKQYVEITPQRDNTGEIALNALFSYYKFNSEQGLNDEELYQELLHLKSQLSDYGNPESTGGFYTVNRHDIQKVAKIDLQDFFRNRYSVRDFTEEEVDLNLIEQAVKMAQKTPSVCNRQSAKVYVFSKEEDKKQILQQQNGNRGFGHKANKVLIVTSNLEHFIWAGERNQGWIDGGMFAMSIVYALHSLGLGSCCLNWCVSHEKDQTLKKVAGINDSEVVVMMIAVGHLPEHFKVAQSVRKNIEEVMIIK
ncbi:MAG: nitroreductase family protein [Microcystaceae cyanobacterium]